MKTENILLNKAFENLMGNKNPNLIYAHDEDLASYQAYNNTITIFGIDQTENEMSFLNFSKRKYTFSKTNVFWNPNSEFDKLLETYLDKSKYNSLISYFDVTENETKKTGLILNAYKKIKITNDRTRWGATIAWLKSHVVDENGVLSNESKKITIDGKLFIFSPDFESIRGSLCCE